MSQLRSGVRVLLSVVGCVLLLAPAAPADEPDYTPDPTSLRRHQVPQWFNDAKLGFFVHWGPYAVPAFAPLSGGNAYAEWYWNELNRSGSPTQQVHRERYGEDFPYDGFIEQWKAERFDPDAWLRLFQEGGGKYFVQVSKHHDGVALFDTKTTDRSTVKLGPGRDFVSELFSASERYDLKRGLYYSLPEWFHPDNGAFGGTFGQGPPKNPFTGQEIPYTGYKEIGSYVDDHQYPQMLEIIDQYDPDILWCDIGGPNRSNEVMAHYFNQAKNRPRPKEVTVDNRCGNGVHDFTTPEYDVEPDITESKWEATRGIGRSFGYNAEEGPEQYLSPNELIDSFVDVVSKNGTLLLNCGPRADGTIPEIQAERVRALGDWLKVNGEAIYGSTYWTQAADEHANVRLRFTTQPKAFYMTALDWPGERLVVSADVPLSVGDEIRLLGQRRPLRWHRDADGNLVVEMPRRPAEDAYTFRIAQRGYDPARTPQLGLGASADDGAAGETSTVKVALANRGDEAIDGGRLTIRPPAGWGSSIEQRFGTLAPHTRQTIEVAVTVPPGTKGGDYPLELEATVGRHTYTAQASVRVIGPTTTVDLSSAFDNDGISTEANRTDGDFDTSGYTYPAEELPAAGEVRFGRVPFRFGSGADGAENNVIADGETLTVPAGRYRRAHVLTSASYGPGTATATIAYADGSTSQATFTSPDWANGGDTDAVIRTTYRNGPDGQPDGLAVRIYHERIDVDPAKEIRSIAISKAGGGDQAAVHVFALTLEE
jgi:alpha-L-fucosidase